MSGFAFGGFPNTTTYFGIEAEGLRFLDGVGRANAGDLSVARLQPEGFTNVYGDTYPLQGVQVRWRGENRAFAVFAGSSKFVLALPGQEERRPFLAGAEYLLRFDRNVFDGALTLVDHPVYADPGIQRDRDALVRLSYMRAISPSAFVFADAYGGGGEGFRLGGFWNFQLGQASAAVYHFDKELPLLSIFNPGERGVEASGSYRPSELSTLTAQIYYVAADVVGDRKELRGQIGYGYSFGSSAPYIFVSYSRDQLAVASFDEDISSIGDRFTLSATKATQSNYSSVTLDRVQYRVGFAPDRTQLVATDQRIVRINSFLENSLVVQSERGTVGATLESAIELPWRGPWFVLYGAGAAYISGTVARGEAVIRLGLSRRIPLNGLYGRTEVRIPVNIGLPRSRLNRSVLTLDVGARFGWQEIRNLRATLAPILTPNQFGSISGRVTMAGEGMRGVVILVNGDAAAETDATGAFRIGRAPVGAANVSVDVTRLEQGLSVVGESSRDVTVQPRQVTPVEFAIARFTTFRGSLVVCENGRPKALTGARLSLINADTAIPLQVTASGGFQAADVTPGEYDIVIDPTSVQGIAATELPPLHVDLRQDVLAFVIGIRCPEAMTARRSTTPAPAPVAPTIVEAIPAPAPAPIIVEVLPPVAPAPAPLPAPVPVPVIVEVQRPAPGVPAPVPSPEPTPAPVIVEVLPPVSPAPAPLPATVPVPVIVEVTPSPAPTPSPVMPAAVTSDATLERAAALVRDEDFAAALALFDPMAPIPDTRYRYYYAVALYERGRYADAKREIATAAVPDSVEAARYVAKIEGAIVP